MPSKERRPATKPQWCVCGRLNARHLLFYRVCEKEVELLRSDFSFHSCVLCDAALYYDESMRIASYGTKFSWSGRAPLAIVALVANYKMDS